jgi:hypothetical protein
MLDNLAEYHIPVESLSRVESLIQNLNEQAREPVSLRVHQNYLRKTKDFFKPWEKMVQIEILGKVPGFLANAPSGYQEKYFDLKDVLASSIRVFRKNRYEDNSAYKVAYVFTKPFDAELVEDWENHCKLYGPDNANAQASAQKVINWIDQENPDDYSDYIHNLKKISQLSALTYQEFGLVVSSVWAYMRNVEKSELNEKAISNEYIGIIGERKDYELKFIGFRLFDYHLEVRVMWKFEDAAGNLFVWWTSAVQAADDPGIEDLYYKDLVIKKSVTYQIRGTVKKHIEFKGRKQTTLNRCVIKEIGTEI